MKVTLFTLDEANLLIPFLNERIARLRATKGELDALLAGCQKRGVDVQELFKNEPKDEELAALRVKLQTLGDEVNDTLFDIQEQGAVVKDIDQGLVDFYCELNGETVFLCWRHGESEVRFWHGLDEGFANRKSLMERRFLESVTKLH